MGWIWDGNLKIKVSFSCPGSTTNQPTDLQCNIKGPRQKGCLFSHSQALANYVCIHATLFWPQEPPPSHWKWWKISIVAKANIMRVQKPNPVPSYELFTRGKIGISFRYFRGIVSAGLNLSPLTLSHALQHLFVYPSVVPYYNVKCRLFEGRDCIFSTSG